MTTPIVPSITDEQLAELEDYCSRPIFRNDADAPLVMGELRGLIARLRDAEKDAARYRFLMSGAVQNGTLGINGGWIDFEDKQEAQQAIDTAMEQSK